MPTKKDASDTTPAEGAEISAVNEPTKYATAAEDRDAPAYAIATRELFAHGVRAHMPGDRVPTVNVERFGWNDGVRAE